jgi:hypothetical protein
VSDGSCAHRSKRAICRSFGTPVADAQGSLRPFISSLILHPSSFAAKPQAPSSCRVANAWKHTPRTSVPKHPRQSATAPRLHRSLRSSFDAEPAYGSEIRIRASNRFASAMITRETQTQSRRLYTGFHRNDRSPRRLNCTDEQVSCRAEGRAFLKKEWRAGETWKESRGSRSMQHYIACAAAARHLDYREAILSRSGRTSDFLLLIPAAAPRRRI